MHSRRRKKIRLPLVEYDWTNIFSITVSTQDRYEWFAYHPRLADEIVSVVLHASRERGSGLLAWCVMPDHVHLLLRDADVVAFVRLFKGRCTPVARLFEKERRLWQRSFFDHGVRREESLLDIARYILANPVKAGLVVEAKDYKWSGSEAWPAWREDNWSPIAQLTTLSVEEQPCSRDVQTPDNVPLGVPNGRRCA